jgi:2-polyprenyl-3-methyl-5-hydroxy-6-metoxy-1,4-benzoquinol methylase
MKTKPPAVVMEAIEHHDPLGRDDYLSIEHLERYRFAFDRLRPGLRVLDIACGAGYGSGILVERGCEVVGADCDERTVELAASRIDGAEFRTANALALPFADASFDVVVTFETIEHVADGAGFLAEMRRVLRPGGTLICSTPNIAYTRHPACHLHEYRPLEFFHLVEAAFGAGERLGQYIRRRDRLRDLYAWRAKPLVLGIADLTGIRPLYRKLRARAADPAALAAPTSPQGAIPYQTRLRAFLDRGPDPDHHVRSYESDERLRIMVAVARKEASR